MVDGWEVARLVVALGGGMGVTLWLQAVARGKRDGTTEAQLEHIASKQRQEASDLKIMATQVTDLATKLGRIETALIGLSGDNGLTGRVTKVEQALDGLQKTLTALLLQQPEPPVKKRRTA